MTTDTLWYTRCPVPTGFGIAAATGALDKEFEPDGLLVRSLASSSDRVVRQSHFEHTQPSSFRHGGPIPPLIAASRGADIAIVGLSWLLGRSVLLGVAGSPQLSPADLRGKRLSLASRANESIDYWRATQLFAYERILARGGLTLDDVELVDVAVDRTAVGETRTTTRIRDPLWDTQRRFGNQREEALALLHGEVDLLLSVGALSTITEGAFGLTVVLDISSGDGRSDADRGVSILTVSRSLLHDDPSVVGRALAVAHQAARVAAENPDQTRRLIARETGLPEELVVPTFGPEVHQRLGFDLAEDKRDALRGLAAFLSKHEFLEQEINVDDLIVTEFDHV